MALKKTLSEELQKVIMSAIRDAMSRYERGSKQEVSEFTCYGFQNKYGGNEQRYMAYVCTNISTDNCKDEAYLALEQDIEDSVSKAVYLFQGKNKTGVELHSIRSMKKTTLGQNYSSLGYHWPSAY